MTRAYSSYLDSGSKWLDQIPSHWRLERLKYVARPQASNVDKHSKSDEVCVRLCNYTDVYKNELITDDLDFMEATATQSEIEKFSLGEDDVIITKDSESWEDIAVPAYVPAAIAGVLCGYHLTQIRSNKKRLHGRYLFYQLQSVAINRQFQVKANGVTRFGLPAYHIDNAEILVPPVDEQLKIGRFLNSKLSRIDLLIRKKETLITQLHEQRISTVTRAVTQGLNAGVSFRPTNSPWLPEVPAHWEFKRLRFLLSAPLMYGANEAAEFDEPDWPRFIRITDVNADGSLRPETFKSLPPEIAAPYRLVPGDILLARSGATVGKSFKYDTSWGDAAFAGYMIRARFDESIADYVAWFLRSETYWNWVRGMFIQATIQNISAEKYANLWLPLPPSEERSEITRYTMRRVAQIDEIETSIRAAVVKLTEYRSALITAAVTGQIEVV